MKNLSQGLNKYMERYMDVYERDIQRVSELFSKVHLAVQVDTATPGIILCKHKKNTHQYLFVL